MSKAANKRNKLAELRALRASGKKAYDTYEVAEERSLYEEVDENEYKKIVRDRLNQDDFVVDDNGEGYVDDGREEWDQARPYYSESEDDAAAGPRERKSSEFESPLLCPVLVVPYTHALPARQTETRGRLGKERCE